MIAQLTSGGILAIGLIIAFCVGWFGEWLWRDRK